MKSLRLLVLLAVYSAGFTACKPAHEGQSPAPTPKQLASPTKPEKAGSRILINGAGATFPAPLYLKWFADYNQKVDPSVQINYQPIGSGGGQKQILAQTVDFGASDAPMSDENLAKAPGRLLHIPTVAGAVVITYNLPNHPKLKLDGPTVADIYLGKISKWNDGRIRGQNPGLELPSQDILVVHRSEASGTSFIFTSYLSAVSPEWKEKAGANVSVQWPAGLGGKGNEGVSGQVKQTPGSIGYVELIYALQNKLAFADLKNAGGQYVTPSLASVTAAMKTAQIPEDFRFSIINAPGSEAYPIAGATWLLVYQRQDNPVLGKKIVEFLNWAETKGQDEAPSLDYSPLPDTLRGRVLERIRTIQF